MKELKTDHIYSSRLVLQCSIGGDFSPGKNLNNLTE